ncbi:unnamed protein product [Arabis nemorensis]|uniref:Aminotransferase-like plant mobile domain-containing protein n=1 Tax=Arabis nemorensis TaxID=586526 RepID=A0A565BGL4_9BRAS|nr:unnamed protein product [Arabis nemorensis]
MRDSVEKLEKVRLQYRNGDCRTSTSRRSITTDVIPIAIRLARGERIALAPAVLAGIYSDLDRIRDLAVEECDKKS